jgi:hypothetical protein
MLKFLVTATPLFIALLVVAPVLAQVVVLSQGIRR